MTEVLKLIGILLITFLGFSLLLAWTYFCDWLFWRNKDKKKQKE